MAENANFQMTQVRILSKCDLEWGVTTKAHKNHPDVFIRVYRVSWHEDSAYPNIVEEGIIAASVSKQIQDAGDANWQPTPGVLKTGLPEGHPGRMLFKGGASFSQKRTL